MIKLYLNDLTKNIFNNNPNSIALKNSKKEYTYADLLNYCCHYQKIFNIKPNQLVGICLPKGIDYYCAQLAVTLSGAIFVPISYDGSSEYTTRLLSKYEIDHLITDESQYDLFDKKLISLIKFKKHNKNEIKKIAIKETQLEQHNNGYLIFTSGSTGLPKAVHMKADAAWNTIGEIQKLIPLSSSDAIFSISQPFFDLSIFDIFGGLSCGATVLVNEQNEQFNTKQWSFYIENLTVWNSTPSLFQLALNQISNRKLKCPAKNILLSGDFIPVDLIKNAYLQLDAAQLYALGGATEAGIWSNYHKINRSKIMSNEYNHIPYGRALPQQTMDVVDEDFVRCKPGEHGEIIIGGGSLAFEYYKNKKQSAFVINPQTNLRVYKTGDLAYYDEHHIIHILGRIDDQVKIRGCKVSLSEIDNCLIKHPHVSNVKALGHNKKLYAFIISTGATDSESLKKLCRTALPSSHIPSEFVFIEAMPLCQNGKVNRSQLLTKIKQSDPVSEFKNQLLNNNDLKTISIANLNLSSLELLNLIDWLEREKNISVDFYQTLKQCEIKLNNTKSLINTAQHYDQSLADAMEFMDMASNTNAYMIPIKFKFHSFNMLNKFYDCMHSILLEKTNQSNTSSLGPEVVEQETQADVLKKMQQYLGQSCHLLSAGSKFSFKAFKVNMHYVLVAFIHHSIIDGKSLGNIYRNCISNNKIQTAIEFTHINNSHQYKLPMVSADTAEFLDVSKKPNKTLIIKPGFDTHKKLLLNKSVINIAYFTAYLWWLKKYINKPQLTIGITSSGGIINKHEYCGLGFSVIPYSIDLSINDFECFCKHIETVWQQHSANRGLRLNDLKDQYAADHDKLLYQYLFNIDYFDIHDAEQGIFARNYPSLNSRFISSITLKVCHHNITYPLIEYAIDCQDPSQAKQYFNHCLDRSAGRFVK